MWLNDTLLSAIYPATSRSTTLVVVSLVLPIDTQVLCCPSMWFAIEVILCRTVRSAEDAAGMTGYADAFQVVTSLRSSTLVSAQYNR